jgi:hypothetical protein
MEMVGHQAITEQFNWNAIADIDHRLDKGVIIPWLVEDRLTPVAPIQGMIEHPTY